MLEGLVVIFLIGSVFTLILSFIVFYRFFRFFGIGFSEWFMFDSVEVDGSMVSVVIPVRNEEGRLSRLLETIKDCGFKEIIVVDDDSTDRTYEVARNFGVKVLRVKEYYKDRFGKSIACYVGAINSTGDFILFLDADVWFEKGAERYIFSKVPKDGVLTILPYHEVKKFYEVFSVYFNIVSFMGLDFGKSEGSPYVSDVGYFGPFLLVRRSDYLEVGGHLSVYDSIVEDLELGKLFAKNSLKIYSIPSKSLVKFRMYSEGFSKLVDGWTKNISLGAVNSSINTILGVSGLVGFTVNIVFFGFFSIFTLFLWEWFLLLYLVYSLLFYFVSSRVGNFGRYFLLYPIFGWFFVFVFLRSFLVRFKKGKVIWRDREVEVK